MEVFGRLADGSRDPLVTIAVLEAIAWHACYSHQTELRSTARQIVESVTWSFEMLLTVHLTGGHNRLNTLEECEGEDAPDRDENAEGRTRWDRRVERLTAERKRIADELVERWPMPSEGAEVICERLGVAQNAEVSAAAGEFLAHLAKRHPTYGEALARYCLENPETPIAVWLAALIGGIMPTQAQAAMGLTEAAARSDASSLRAAAANACGQAAYSETPDGRYVEVLRTLLNDSDTWVRRQSIHALAAAFRKHADFALELALEVELGSDSKLADDFFAALAMPGTQDYADLDLEVVRRLIAKTELVNDLSEYWTSRFLDHASEVAPREVVQLLLRRASLESESADFRALPYRFEASFSGFGQVTDRAELLREIRDLSKDASGRVEYWLPALYSAISQDFDKAGQSVLNEWIDAGEPALIAAAANLLASADWHFVLRYPDFVVNLLRRARQAGPECLDTTTAALHRSVETRGGTGIPGEPMPHDVEVRDSATAISQSLLDGSAERAFFEAVAADAAASIRRHLEWDEEVGL